MTKHILLVTDGIFHPPLWGRITLYRLLRQMDGVILRHVRSLEKLPADVGRFSALVLHYHHERLSPAALARLDEYTRSGGGILALHAATASFTETLSYFDILGGKFIGHGAVEPFEVVNQGYELFRGIPDFTVTDELYIHELREGIQVHFAARHEGQDVPVVWTYRYGKGRVCYAVPGHTNESMSNPAYQEVLRRGLAWVAE
jgi:type 1 glutamine amidotransferase